jgi:hypothetical protein
MNGNDGSGIVPDNMPASNSVFLAELIKLIGESAEIAGSIRHAWRLPHAWKIDSEAGEARAEAAHDTAPQPAAGRHSVDE